MYGLTPLPPYGAKARYPLPFEWAAQGKWNMTWVPDRVTHNALHAQIKTIESWDKFRESTIFLRQAGNRVMIYLEEEGVCWESIETSVVYDMSGTVNQNQVPTTVEVEQVTETTFNLEN